MERKKKPSPNKRQLLIQQALLLAELERRQKEAPILHFKPHRLQQRFFNSTAPIVMMSGGNRLGKTHALVALSIALAWGYRLWETGQASSVDGNFKPREEVPESAWILRTDGLPIQVPNRVIYLTGLTLERGIGEIFWEKFRQLVPKDVLAKCDIKTGTLGIPRKVVWPNGSELILGSAQQQKATRDMSFEGFAADAALFDEPLDRKTYIAVKRGLIDRQGRLWWSLTPVGPNCLWIASDLLQEERADVELIQGDPLEENPFIDRAAFEAFLDDAAMTDEEREARRYGRFSMMSRNIVTTFGDHAIIEPTEIPLHIPRVMVSDPHHARPTVSIWAAVYDDGERLVIYREDPDYDMTKGRKFIPFSNWAAQIKALEGREPVLWRLVDPQFGPAKPSVLGQREQSFVERAAEYGLVYCTEVDNTIDAGIDRLREAFRISDVTGRPRVQIFRSCRNTIRALQLWSYEESASGVLKVSEKYKDRVDVVRYLLSARIPFYAGAVGGYNYLEDNNVEKY